MEPTTLVCYFLNRADCCCAASIPVYCTGPALILTGALMMINVTKIDWNDTNKAVPAFITISIMVMPCFIPCLLCNDACYK